MPATSLSPDLYAQSTKRLSPTMRAFAFVLALHAGLLLLLHSVMQTSIPAKLAEAISAHIIQEFKPPEPPKLVPPAPPVPPKAQTPPPVQAAPALPSQAPIPLAQAPSAAPAITAAPSQATPPAPTAPAAPQPTTPSKPAIVTPPSRVESSCAAPRYPAASERLREEGVVTLRFLISENGQVVSGAVDKSSGFKRLDDAALAALSLCKFKPATVDGKPKQDWSALRYRWELKDD
jgi:periplasmic protein TonB